MGFHVGHHHRDGDRCWTEALIHEAEKEKNAPRDHLAAGTGENHLQDSGQAPAIYKVKHHESKKHEGPGIHRHRRISHQGHDPWR
jgi:hypothetical protein